MHKKLQRKIQPIHSTSTCYLANQGAFRLLVLEAVLLARVGGVGPGVDAAVHADLLRLVRHLHLEGVHVVQVAHAGDNTDRAAFS